MPHVAQRLADVITEPALNLHDLPIGKGPRRVYGALQVHTKILQVRCKARVTTWLIGSAHHAKGNRHLAILADHAGDDCMHRAFAALQFVRMAFFQRETRTAVLQKDAELVRSDSRAKPVENGIDQRHRHTVAIHNGDVDRVLMHRLAERCGGSHGVFRVDQSRERTGGFGCQHMLQPRCMVRVRQKAVARVIGQFRCLCFNVQSFGTLRVHPGDIKMTEDIEQ